MKCLPALAALVFACLAHPTQAPAAESLFKEEFKGQMQPGWTWLREDRTAWRLTTSGVEIRVQPGNMWGGANDARNVLLREAPDSARGPVEATLRLENHPTGQYEQVDLVWYYDDSNMVKIGQEIVDGALTVVMGREQNDRCRTLSINKISEQKVQLRLRVEGGRIRGQFRPGDAEKWSDAGSCDLPVKGPPKISLQCYQGVPGQEHWAKLSEVIIRQSLE
jgi:regulation of enolase protein 1 (concanavalin A-like superfamily)